MNSQSSLDSVRDTKTRARHAGARPSLNVTFNVNDLLRKLGSVQEGSRELDLAIGEYLGEIPNPLDGWIPVQTISKIVEDVPEEIGTYLRLDTLDDRFLKKRAQRHELPKWSSSQDAAFSVMTRFLPDCTFSLRGNDDGSYSAVVDRLPEFLSNNTGQGGSAPTPALALMLAIIRMLRARMIP